MAFFKGVTSRVLPTKQEALFFDSVIPTSITWNMASLPSQVMGEFEYLVDRAIITSAPSEVGPFDAEDPEFQYLESLYETVEHKVQEYQRLHSLEAASQTPWDIMSVICKNEMGIIVPIGIRILARTLRKNHGLDAIAILDATPMIPSEAFRLESTASIIIKSLPMPEDNVSWEQIIDFRANDDARHQLIALRRWVRALTKEHRPINEVEEELEYHLGEYERHMRLHRMKYQKGVLRTIISVSADFLTSALRLDFKKAVDAIFALEDQKIRLLEAEFTAPGQEIAYIIRAGSTFQE